MKSKCCNKEMRVDRNMLSYTQEEVSEDVGQLVGEFKSVFYKVMGLETDNKGNNEMYLIRNEDGIIEDNIDFRDERGELQKWLKQALQTAYEAGKIDGINDIRERNHLVRREDKMYVQDCIATDNRDWIEPHIRAVAKAEMKGARSGYSQGYEAGLKENKILPENCK